MTEADRIKRELARNGNIAYNNAKNTTGAYIMRGNSTVRVTADGNIQFVNRIGQVRVRIKDSDRVIRING